MKKSLFPNRRSSAFTLIEILVSIGVILTLVSLGVPVATSAMDRAKQTTCLGHAKQLSLAYLGYRNDNNDSINGLGTAADSTNWMVRMRLYFETDAYDNVRMKYMCPAHPKFLQNNAAHFGWALNSNFDVSSQIPFHKFPQVSNPSRVIYAIEGYRTYNWSLGDGQNPSFTLPTTWLKADKTLPAGQEVIFPHKGAATTVFLDGHIEMLKPPLARETWAIDGV